MRAVFLDESHSIWTAILLYEQNKKDLQMHCKPKYMRDPRRRIPMTHQLILSNLLSHRRDCCTHRVHDQRVPRTFSLRSLFMAFLGGSILGGMTVRYWTIGGVDNGKEQNPGEYKMNEETINLIGKLYEYRFSHHDDENAADQFTNGKGMGNLLQRKQERKIWAALSHDKGITNPQPVICEIGFAWGFSAVVILAEHPSAKYVGFDIGHTYSWDAFTILKESYQDRLQVIWGDSSTNIRKMADDPENTIHCDIWIIDGAHSYEGAKKDMNAILDTVPQLSNPNSLILFDDCDCGDGSGHVDTGVVEREWPTEGVHQKPQSTGPTKVFTEAVKEGRMEYISHGTEKDSLGRFIGWCLSRITE